MGLINKQIISVSCDTDGLNSLVSQVVTLICQKTGLSIIDKIEYGSEEFEGFPIYNTPHSSFRISSVFTKNTHMSDIYILGLNKNNYCLFVNVYNGYLLLGLGHSLDYGERYSVLALEKYPTMAKHCPLAYVTRYQKGINDYRSRGNYCMGVPLIKTGEGMLNIIICNYNGSNSQGVKFVVDTKESDWILFSNDDNNNKYCLISLRENNVFSNFQKMGTDTNVNSSEDDSMLVVKFNSEIPLYKDMIVSTGNDQFVVESLTKSYDNSYCIPYIWNDWCPESSSNYDYIHYKNCMARTNTINYKFNFMNEKSESGFLLDSIGIKRYGTPLNSVLNLPKLGGNQVYLRKLFAPDYNKKFNLYLWYSPVVTQPAPNSFYEVGNDIYLLITNKCIGYALKV